MNIHDTTGRWQIIQGGRRRWDTTVAVDWEGARVCVITTVGVMLGTDLERLPLNHKEQRQTAIVKARDWKGCYFLAYRPGWSPDDYFIHAAKLLGLAKRTP